MMVPWRIHNGCTVFSKWLYKSPTKLASCCVLPGESQITRGHLDSHASSVSLKISCSHYTYNNLVHRAILVACFHALDLGMSVDCHNHMTTSSLLFLMSSESPANFWKYPLNVRTHACTHTHTHTHTHI